jgi:Chaperone of endosialidase
MSKGGDSPPAPDYAELAQEQSLSSQQLAAQQTYANRPDVATPWGNLSYTTGSAIDPATGDPVTTWGENVGLTPDEATSVQNQQQIAAGESGTALNLLQGINGQINTPPGTAPQTAQMTGAGAGMDYNPGQINQQAEDAVWNQFQNMQVPLQQQQTQATSAQLQAQGLKPGDAAYDTAMKNLENTQFSQTQTAEDQAVGAGMQEGATEFGEANAAQAQGFGQNVSELEYNNAQIPQNISNEEAMLGLGQEQSGYDINMLNALMNGEQVGMPSFPGSTSASGGQPVQSLQAGEDAGQAALNAYNAQTGAANATDNSLMGLIGTGLMYYGMTASDERLKENLKRDGETDEGVPIYTFNYKGSPVRQRGVMAQDMLEHGQGHAVARDPRTSMFAVDYSKVHES